MFEPRSDRSDGPSRTRFHFQLASLMDLLLIIVFAQFLEFRQAQESVEKRSLADVASRKAELEQELRSAEEEFRQLASELRSNRERAQRERDDAVAMAAAADRERAVAVEAIVELLQTPPSTFDPAVSSEDATSSVASAGRRADRLSDVNATEVLRFLAGYDELLKRAEVWTLHASDRGQISIDNGQQEEVFRLESASQPARAREFADRLHAATQSFPQPKGLVVVLASYSPLAIAGTYQPMIDGLPRAVERLTADNDGQTRFEYAVIGAIIDPERDLQQISSPGSTESVDE